ATPAMAGTPPTVPGCSQPQCPAWPWALPGIQGQPQLLWAPWARACPPCQGTIPHSQDPIQPCPLPLAAIP
ncbi:unnamed protein product, partial [Coccothraustes coccothraustes]